MRDYSYSRLSLFESCGAAFKFKYIDKLPEAASKAVLRGRVIHEIVDAYNRHCLSKGVPTDITSMPEIANRCFYEKPRGYTSDMYPEALAVAERFAASHVLNLSTVVGSEEWMQVWLIGKKHLFRSKIDLIEIEGDTATITDWKTDWQVRSQDDVEKDFQLRVYAWQTHKEYPQTKNFKVKLDFVRHDVVREVEFDLGTVALVENQVMGLIGQVEQAIAKKAFPPRPGAFCGWCGYATLCPAAKDIPADVRPVNTPEDAQKVAEELAVLERLVAVRKEALKAYCNVAGPVEANGLVWGFHLTQSNSIEDVEAFVRTMNELGRDPRPFLAVSGTKAKKLYSLPEIEPLLVDRSYTRFDSKKVKGGDAA